MSANIVKVACEDASSLSEASLRSILSGPVAALQADEAVGMPTETVYGLAANCLRAEAASKIFSIKNRPTDNPLICHISSFDMLRVLVDPSFEVSERTQAVMDRFWPGPLTLLFPVHPDLPACVTAGLPTVGVRFPAHLVAQKLIEFAGFPLAAPSANLSGRPSPTAAHHVFHDLHDRIQWIVDGGSAGVGLESTVVDMLRDPPVILRPGGITLSMLQEVVPEMTVYRQKKLREKADGFDDAVDCIDLDESRPSTPGMKYRHYSPNAPVWLFALRQPSGDIKRDSISLAPLIDEYLHRNASDKKIVRLSIIETSENSVPIIYLSKCGNLVEIAQNLFGALRAADEMQPDVIVAEAVAEEEEGLAVMNRLIKSAGEEVIYLE